MSLASDMQELIDDLFDNDLTDMGVAHDMTYHVRTSVSGDYDPDTGTFASFGDGALWYNDADNSHHIPSAL